MLRGLATVTFYTDDMAASTRWYTELLGIEPYYTFTAPDGTVAYTEFRVGDREDEFGFIDARFCPGARVPGAGAIANWHVDDIEATLARLIELGATVHEPITPRGEEGDFVTASVVDPFGNLLGIMYNPHYLEMLQVVRSAATA